MSTLSNYAVWGVHAGTGPDYSLEAAVTRIEHDIATMHRDGELPDYVTVHVALVVEQRIVDMRVQGLSPTDSGVQLRALMTALFEVASNHNLVPLTNATPPRFTQRIVLLDQYAEPFAALVGAGIGDVEPLGIEGTALPN